MKAVNTKAKSLFVATAAGLSLGLFLPHQAAATDYTFTGTGSWYASPSNPNWTPTPSPGLFNNTLDMAGNTALVQGVVDYNAGPAGGDFMVGNGDSMTVDGAGNSWTQAASVGNWVKVGGSGGTGTVVVQNGASFVEASTGARLRLGLDGAGGASVTGIVTVASTAGAGGIRIAGLTEMNATSQINLQGGTNSFAEIQLPGTLNVSGGTSTMSGALATSATTVINVTGGSYTATGNNTVALNAASKFNLSGTATFKTTGTGEFQPGYTFNGGASLQSISGSATLDVTGLVAFQGNATQKFDVNGGSITLRATGYDGIYSNGGYFNFTSGSTGSMFFPNDATAETNIFESQIRYNDTAYTSANFGSVFNVTHANGGTTITLLNASVPEPSTWLGAGLLLGVVGFSKRKRLSSSFEMLRSTLG